MSERESRHRIDWAAGVCEKCGVAHDAALDFAPCVPWPLGRVFDYLLDMRDTPNDLRS